MYIDRFVNWEDGSMFVLHFLFWHLRSERVPFSSPLSSQHR